MLCTCALGLGGVKGHVGVHSGPLPWGHLPLALYTFKNHLRTIAYFPYRLTVYSTGSGLLAMKSVARPTSRPNIPRCSLGPLSRREPTFQKIDLLCGFSKLNRSRQMITTARVPIVRVFDLGNGCYFAVSYASIQKNGEISTTSLAPSQTQLAVFYFQLMPIANVVSQLWVEPLGKVHVSSNPL